MSISPAARRAVVATVAVAALLVLAGNGVAPDRHGPGRAGAPDRAASAGMFGTFDEVGGGDFVSFDVSRENGNVTNLTVDRGGSSLEVVESASFTPDGDAGSTDRIPPRGPYAGFSSEALDMVAYDQPDGPILRAAVHSPGNFTFDLPDGIRAEVASQGPPTVVTLSGSDGPVGRILAGGGASDVSASQEEAFLRVEDEGLVFIALDPWEAPREETELRRALDEAMVQGRLSSSLEVTGVEGVPAQLAIDGRWSQGPPTVSVVAREAGDGHVRAEAAIPHGMYQEAVLHLSIDRQNLDATADNIRPKFDGEPVPVTDDLEAVIEDTERVEPQAFIRPTEGTLEVVLSPGVPDYDPAGEGIQMHTVVVADEEARPNPWPPIRAENPLSSGTARAEHVRQAAADQAEGRDMIHDQTLQDGLDRARETGLFDAGPDPSEAAEGPDRGDFVTYDARPSEGRIADLAVETGDGEVPLLSEIGVEGRASAEGGASEAMALAGEDVAVDVGNAPGAPTTISAGDGGLTMWFNGSVEDCPSTYRVADGAMLLDYPEGVGVLAETTGDTEFVPKGCSIEVHMGANAGVHFAWSPDRTAVEDGPWESTETAAVARGTEDGRRLVVTNTYLTAALGDGRAPGTEWVPGAQWIPGSEWIPGTDWVPGSDWIPGTDRGPGDEGAQGPDWGATARLAAAGDRTVGSVTPGSVAVTPGEATETGVTATLESSVDEPRLVDFLVPREDLNGTSSDEITVTLDGSPVEEVPPDRLIGGEAIVEEGDTYAGADAGEAVHVLLQVEGFSEHEVTIAGGAGGGAATPGPGALALVAAAGAALGLARLRRP